LLVKTRVLLACAFVFLSMVSCEMLWKIVVGATTTPFCAYKVEKQMQPKI